MFYLTLIIPYLYVFSFVKVVFATDLKDELRVTFDQRQAIYQLRHRTLRFITDDYMKEDLHLLRMLRVSNFNLDKAEERMREDVKWRQQNKISTIIQEDFSDVERDYPLGYTTDKQGQPVFIAYAGDWDIRAATLTGRIPRVYRYIIQAVEKLFRHLRQLQLNGHNVTRYSVIDDLGNFNIRQHGCPACLYRILECILLVEDHYPGIVDRFICVNTPPTIAALSELIRTNASPDTWQAYKFYGRDRAVWQKALLEFIDKDKLPERLGGTMKITIGNFYLQQNH